MRTLRQETYRPDLRAKEHLVLKDRVLLTQVNAAALQYVGSENNVSAKDLMSGKDLPCALMSTPWQEAPYIVVGRDRTITFAELAERTRRAGTAQVRLRKHPHTTVLSVTASRTNQIDGQQAITFILSPERELSPQVPPSQIESKAETHGDPNAPVDAATLLDSLPESTVAIDRNGTVIAVGRSRMNSGKQNDAELSAIRVGTNYLDACRRGLQ